MNFVNPEVILQAKQMDLLTYLQNYEPNELVRISGNVYCTKTHDSLKFSNGKGLDPFPQKRELKTKSTRLDELNILLNMNQKDNELVTKSSFSSFKNNSSFFESTPSAKKPSQ